MGSLLPTLFLVPFFLGAAWLFRDRLVFVVPLLLAPLVIVGEYLRQYAGFVRRDPDRLQSEQFRYEMKRMHMIAAKELPYPIPADALPLPSETSNPTHPLPDLRDVVGGDKM